MKYQYYVRMASGIGKKSNRPWWAIYVFGLDMYGEVNVIPIFLQNQEEFDRLQKLAPPQFTPVEINVNPASKLVTVFKPVDGVPKLNAQ